MRPTFAIVPLVAALLSPPAHAAVCALPVQPEIPDGKTASGADMLRAKKALEVFMAELAKYLECDSTPIKQHRAKQRAAAIEEAFNEQMRIYREKG